MSVAAYKANIREVESPRDIERRILLRITGEMEDHATAFDTAKSKTERLNILSSGLRDALAENEQFWSALKFDLAEPGNKLPTELRASLISVALWVERQTNECLGGASGIAALVSTNRAIAAGLAGRAITPKETEV
jgi:flagellar protein FlaF